MAMPTAARPNPIALTHRLSRRGGQATKEAGVSLIGLLVTLAIVGALAAAVPLLTSNATISSGGSKSSDLNASTANPSTSGEADGVVNCAFAGP
jgi:hypothetical protein